MQTSTSGCVSVSEHTQMFNGGLSGKAVESGSSQPEHAPLSPLPTGLLHLSPTHNATVCFFASTSSPHVGLHCLIFILIIHHVFMFSISNMGFFDWPQEGGVE